MADYAAIVRELAARRRFGVRPGLSPMQAALDRIGNPERSAPAVHIAGTNGKGSTAAMTAALLRAAGKRTALYTSPHLCRLTERFVLDGQPIAEAELAPRLVAAMRREPELTFFEIVTLVAFEWFAAAQCDAWVVEVGLGGRLDATNTLGDVAASVIVSIGYDHQSILGDSLAEIAREKAGIARPGVPLFIGPMVPDARAEIATYAATVGALLRPIERVDRRVPAQLGLLGAHQRMNASLALAAADVLVEKVRADALTTVSWPGRAEWLRADLLVDGAHNREAAATLAAILDARPGPAPVLIFGASADKPIAEMLMLLAPRASQVIMTRAANERALSPEALASMWPGAHAAPDVAGALELAQRLAASCPIVVTGSLFLVGEVRAHIHGLPTDPPWVADPPVAAPAKS